MQLKRAIPILRIFSVEKAKEFYLDFLGFTIDWEHRFGENFPLYAQISRAGLALHLSEHHGDCSPGSTVFIWMRGIHDYHRELAAKDYRYYKPQIEDAPVGGLDDAGHRSLREPAALQRADRPRAIRGLECQDSLDTPAVRAYLTDRQDNPDGVL